MSRISPRLSLRSKARTSPISIVASAYAALTSPSWVGYPGGLDFANNVDRIPNLEQTVKARFADKSNVKVTAGFLPETLQECAPESIAFLHGDLNSPRACLERLFDRVSSGGITVLDDYGCFVFREQKRAEDAFFAARGHSVCELPTGQGIIIKK